MARKKSKIRFKMQSAKEFEKEIKEAEKGGSTKKEKPEFSLWGLFGLKKENKKEGKVKPMGRITRPLGMAFFVFTALYLVYTISLNRNVKKDFESKITALKAQYLLGKWKIQPDADSSNIKEAVLMSERKFRIRTRRLLDSIEVGLKGLGVDKEGKDSIARRILLDMPEFKNKIEPEYKMNAYQPFMEGKQKYSYVLEILANQRLIISYISGVDFNTKENIWMQFIGKWDLEEGEDGMYLSIKTPGKEEDGDIEMGSYHLAKLSEGQISLSIAEGQLLLNGNKFLSGAAYFNKIESYPLDQDKDKK